MVAYCCVKGCKNNGNNKKKDPSLNTSFHAFPSNIELKRKWLKAIGRPDWEPPSYARICSAHFSSDQINQDGTRTRIRDDACPVKALPLNSNFEASNVEVCRICLATDLKMHSLQHGRMKHYMETIVGINENFNIEGLPQYVCYECAAHLKKCCGLIEKSVTAQAILLDLFAQNGQITKALVKNLNRDNSDLQSQLFFHKTMPMYLFDFKYDHETNTPFLTNSEFLCEYTENELEIKHVPYKPDNLKNEFIPYQEKNIRNLETDCEFTNHDDLSDTDHDDDGSNCNEIIDGSLIEENTSFKQDTHQKSMDDLKKLSFFEINSQSVKKINLKKKRQEKTNKLKSVGETIEEEKDIKKCFDIIKINTLQEQIEEWKKSAEHPSWLNKGNKAYKCEVCSKLFAHITTYRSHVAYHNATHGDAECPVCKLRFKNEVLVKSHANRVHGKKYFCKSCPKTFTNLSAAKKHQKWHSGHVYKCARCEFSSAHVSALSKHELGQHAHALACARCGRACRSAHSLRQHYAYAHKGRTEQEGGNEYKCEQCTLSFKTEGARRVHILTSKQHRNSNIAQDLTTKNTCRHCGQDFPMPGDLESHLSSEHRRQTKRPEDDAVEYPRHCEHCGASLRSRQAHWRHVRRRHPGAARAYRRVVGAVCHTCGKGFQNPTKLRLHELRHSSPRVRCECGRLFYDKYALARHRAAAHSAARPHVCGLCDRAFKAKSNLARHMRVHTGATPYECTMCGKKLRYSTSLNLHIRTVHLKMPHPPRKKRPTKETRRNTIDNDT